MKSRFTRLLNHKLVNLVSLCTALVNYLLKLFDDEHHYHYHYHYLHRYIYRYNDYFVDAKVQRQSRTRFHINH